MSIKGMTTSMRPVPGSGEPARVIALLACLIMISSVLQAFDISSALAGDRALPRDAPTSPWPMFRDGPARAGHSQVDTANNSGELLWKCMLGGIIYSSPAIGAEGTIYVGCSDHYLYAVRPEGTVAWKFLTGSDIDSSPAIGPDGTVYIGSDKLYALTPRGTVKWSFPTLYGTSSSPVVAPDGRIYIGTIEGTLYGLTPDGRLAGSFNASRRIDSSPALDAAGNIHFGSYDGYVYSLTSNMSLRWSYRTGDYVSATPAIAPDRTAYVGSKDGHLYAIGEAGGLKWSYNIGLKLFSSVAIGQGGMLYLGCYDKNIYAFDASGALRWTFATGGWVDSSPSVGADGAIYVGSGDGRFYALYPNGTLKWSFQTGNEVFGSAAISANGSVIFGSWDRYLYCVGSLFNRPSPPRDLSAVFVDRKAELRWEPPASDGGKPVTAYRLFRGMEPSAGGVIGVLQANVTNFTDPGIHEAGVYYYHLTALNSIGESPPGNEVNLTARFPPTPPRYLRTTPGENSVRLDWDPPVGDGGSPLLAYRIYCSPGESVGGQLAGLEVNVRTYQHTGLVNLVTYTYEVTAVNDVGESDRSNTATAVPRPPASGVPSPPRDVFAMSWDRAVDIFWAAPADDGGHPLIGYRVYREAPSGFPSVVAHPGAGVLTFRDLTVENGLTYRYYVTAFNERGESRYSESVCGMPMAGVVDRDPPGISIIEPANGSIVHSGRLSVRGEALDNSSILLVELSGDGAEWSRANGTTNWSGNLTLSQGRNTLYARATDGWGNNATAQVMVNYVPGDSGGAAFDLPVAIAVLILVSALGFGLMAVRRWRKPPKD